MRLQIGVICVAAGFACHSKTSGDAGGCGSNADCAGGEVCQNTTCLRVCTSDVECNDASKICEANVCVTGTRPNAPEITAIDSDGATDNDSTHAAHRIDRKLTIVGQNLTGASATLSRGASSWGLEVCSSQADRMVVTLPQGMSDGAYTLSVATQAGTCATPLPVLQGEPGPLPQVALAGGLTGVGDSNSPLAVDFGGDGSANTASRSDHTHPALQTAVTDQGTRLTTAEGALTSHGARLAAIEGPLFGPLSFGSTGAVDSQDATSFGRTFSVTPVVVASVREINNSGSVPVRIATSSRSDFGMVLYCAGFARADQVNWIAMQPGSQSIGGKQLQAGMAASGGSTQFAVTFPSVFSSSPAVIVTVDETGDNSGATSCRLATANAAGFSVQCYSDGAAAIPDGIMWLAMEQTTSPVVYQGHSIQAGVTATTAAIGTITFPQAFSATPSVIVTTGLDSNNSGATTTRTEFQRSATSFSYHGHVCGNGDFANEFVHWIAID